MPSIVDLFPPKEVISYIKNREFQPLLGETLFPERKTPSLDWDLLVGANSAPVSASVHAFDTETEIASREAQKMALEGLLIKRKIAIPEKYIAALLGERSAEEKAYLEKEVFNDAFKMADAVRTRIEAMRMEVLATGKLVIDENNVKTTFDYGVSAENQEVLSTKKWSDDSANPIEDIQKWADALDVAPTRALTSQKIVRMLLKHPNVIKAVFGSNNTGRMMTLKELNDYFLASNLPVFAVNNAKYRVQLANGTYATKAYFPENKLVLFGDGALGETIYGPTAEEVRLVNNPAVDVKSVGNIFVGMYDRNMDPVVTETKAAAYAGISFPEAANVFQAQPID